METTSPFNFLIIIPEDIVYRFKPVNKLNNKRRNKKRKKESGISKEGCDEHQG
jgi:hypothetical protein